MGSNIKICVIILCVFVCKCAPPIPDSDAAKDDYHLHKTCQDSLNKLINEEMRVHLTYSVLAAHFNQNNVARKGFTKFFLKKSREEAENAQMVIDFLNLRGESFNGYNIKMPIICKPKNGLDALEEAIKLDKAVYDKLIASHDIAQNDCTDPHLMDYLEKTFFNQKVKSIDALKNHHAVLSQMNNGTGEFLLDRQLLHETAEL